MKLYCPVYCRLLAILCKVCLYLAFTKCPFIVPRKLCIGFVRLNGAFNAHSSFPRWLLSHSQGWQNWHKKCKLWWTILFAGWQSSSQTKQGRLIVSGCSVPNSLSPQTITSVSCRSCSFISLNFILLHLHYYLSYLLFYSTWKGMDPLLHLPSLGYFIMILLSLVLTWIYCFIY